VSNFELLLEGIVVEGRVWRDSLGFLLTILLKIVRADLFRVPELNNLRFPFDVCGTLNATMVLPFEVVLHVCYQEFLC